MGEIIKKRGPRRDYKRDYIFIREYLRVSLATTNDIVAQLPEAATELRVGLEGRASAFRDVLARLEK